MQVYSIEICHLFITINKFCPTSVSFSISHEQAWKKCRSCDLGSDKTADFGIKFGENAILVRVSRIQFTFWGINRMG